MTAARTTPATQKRRTCMRLMMSYKIVASVMDMSHSLAGIEGFQSIARRHRF